MHARAQRPRQNKNRLDQQAIVADYDLHSAAWRSWPGGGRPMALRPRLSPGLPMWMRFSNRILTCGSTESINSDVIGRLQTAVTKDPTRTYGGADEPALRATLQARVCEGRLF